MSATQPASTTELKEYCLRKLGKPVIDVNLADEQMDDICLLYTSPSPRD